MEQLGQESTPQPPAEPSGVESQPASTEVLAQPQPAAPAPAPTEESADELKAKIAALESEVHQRDVTIGRQGAELGELRQQPPAAPTAEPQYTAQNPYHDMMEAALSGDAEGIVSAAQRVEERQRAISREEAVAAGQQVQQTMRFYSDHPHLVGKEALVASVAADMQQKGEFAAMAPDAAMAEVAKRATTQLTPPQSEAPIAPPVSPGTAPPTSPAPPEPPGPEPIDREAAERADRAELGARQRAQKAVRPLKPPE